MNKQDVIMKSTELMIGDWVYVKDYPMKQEAKQVTANHFVRSLCEFEPIPLTEDMLNLNNIPPYPPKETDTFDIDWVIPNGAFHIRQDGNEFWVFEDQVSIRYIHQLQHALRLCGLNDIADNFKIE